MSSRRASPRWLHRPGDRPERPVRRRGRRPLPSRHGVRGEMNQVTRILVAVQRGEAQAAEQLLPLIYDELRKLAAQRLSHEDSAQTLQPTALVHEAYIRLVDVEQPAQWDGRGHFFAAAAEAMRRILIDNARHKRSKKAGGDRHRVDLTNVELAAAATEVDL